uniref:SpaA domain-containing protein n=1 Tax=Syphacia muris TaxID=451379 RepID=A0A0N5AFB1_9BILA
MTSEQSLKLCRDDCVSIQERTGTSCVFAKITSLDPFEISDGKGQLKFDEAPAGVYEVSEHAYFLIDCSAKPLRCLRVTVVPKELESVAAYQLKLSEDMRQERH